MIVQLQQPWGERTVRSRTTLYKFWIWARLIACENASVERRQNLQQIALQHLHTSTQICVFTPSNNRWLASQHCNLITGPLLQTVQTSDSRPQLLPSKVFKCLSSLHQQYFIHERIRASSNNAQYALSLTSGATCSDGWQIFHWGRKLHLHW